MDALPELERRIAGMYNAAYRVRHYWRGRRSGFQREERRQAIADLGMAARAALEAARDADELERVLEALVDGLVPLERYRF